MIAPAATVLALCLGVAQQPADTPVVITNVNVLPMNTDRVLPAQTVVIEHGVITSIGPVQPPNRPTARLIDGAGKYLMPGLVDVHVHFHGNPPEEWPQLLELYIANGVTTIVSLKGNPQILALRDTVNAGRILGPRMYSVGPFINEPFFTTPDEVEREVVAQKRAGYDFIKIHGNLSRAAYHRLNEVARREGIRVVGHLPRNLGPEAAFAEHQYMIAHGEEFLYDTLSRSTDSSLGTIESHFADWARATAAAKIWVTPNLTAYKAIGGMLQNLDSMLARPEMRYLPRSSQIGWGPATNPYTNRNPPLRGAGIMTRYHVLEKLVLTFYQVADVGLLVGTDAMNTGVVPGFSAHDELADLVAAGLSPWEALHAATVNGAEFLGQPGDRGTVAVGQKADLVLLDANPFSDIANSRRIAGVLLRGRWFSRDDIAAMLRELRLTPGDD
jgi:Amidohydrolase family